MAVGQLHHQQAGHDQRNAARDQEPVPAGEAPHLHRKGDLRQAMQDKDDGHQDHDRHHAAERVEVDEHAAHRGHAAQRQMPREQRFALHLARLRDLHDADEDENQAEDLVWRDRRQRGNDDRRRTRRDQQAADQDEQEPVGPEDVGDVLPVASLGVAYSHVGSSPYRPCSQCDGILS